MASYIALLRGINVGANMLPMARLREILAEEGFVDVRTYLQSGNVVLSADATPAKLAALIEERVSAVTRLPVACVVRTPAQLRRIVAGNPFATEAAALPKTVHVTFLAGPPSKADAAALGKISAGADRWQVAATEVYLHCPNGYGRSKLNNTALERALGVRATTRNWSTVLALHAMTAE
jgi:uncharacterized protein (DUF1697 family)